ncbi:daptomycin-sensing surface protein LiaX [Lacticaseibacillus jixianensis]|uniref:Daptomycin-sensing surface protein LiaX n=1 Tax=Lacticaseibacillus jixianensis TaxID=2486012 RepID=A0ABW4B7Q1_9LACO|nr:daptomycin-sensing surface protein LiaX [Lacticaseibacillus jixianensis]
MNERERILDLVKQGVITSEEALVLLENLAKKQSAPQPEQPAAGAGSDAVHQAPDEDSAVTRVNTEIAEVSGELDATNNQIKKTQAKVAANKEQIIVLDTMEDLDTLTTAKYEERGALKRENEQLGEQLVQLAEQQEQLRHKLTALQRNKRQLTKQKLAGILPDDWQDQTMDALNDLGKTVSVTTNQIGAIVKKTVGTVLDNVDWKDVNIKVPGLATEKFSHTFTYPNSQASIIDVKLANGDVNLAVGDGPDIEIQADVKLYGKMGSESSLQAFLDRSRIEVTDDHLVFQVPNKRIQADLTITVPKREYDHVSLRLLNGSVKVVGLNGKDFFAKSTNGDLNFTGLAAVMLETEAVNGNVRTTGKVHDLVVDTVNGDVKFKGEATTLDLKTVNGTVRATMVSDFKALAASSVNGDVKIAVPASVAISGEVKTRFGSVKSRMSGIKADAKTKALSLDRPGTGEGTLKASVSSGTIQLKDTDLEK